MSLEVKNIVKTFQLSKKQQKLNGTKNKKKVAVSDVSFTAYPGEIFGLLGPNGAGKTTTLRTISTLIKPDSGDVLVGGTSVVKDSFKVRNKIGFLTSELKLEDHFTPNYLFSYFGQLHGLSVERIEERKQILFDQFGIHPFAEVKVGDLSTGMKQKTSIAISLVHDPDYIIFDEPTNGLDVLTARSVTDYLLDLKAQNKVVILSTHILSVVEKLCDRVGIIINGQVKVADTMDKVMTKANGDLEEFFFQLIKDDEGEENNA
jgi:sodium transport system ATP-binding protein